MDRIVILLSAFLLTAGLPLAALAQDAAASPDPAASDPGTEEPAAVTETPAPQMEAETSPNPEGQTPKKNPKRQMPPAERLVSKIWWNQPAKISLLKLNSMQRTSMDAILTRYLKKHSQAAKTRSEALEAFGKALAAGDVEAVRQSKEDVAAAMADPTRQQLDMMTEVIGLLSPYQRKTLAEKHPGLLARLWVQNAGPRLQARLGRGPR